MELKNVKGPSKISDPRLRDPKFNRAVKIVFAHLGIENPTHKDFNEFQEYRIDWIEFADRIKRPRFIAICGGDFGKLVTPLFGSTRDEAKMNVPNGYEFKEWFE